MDELFEAVREGASRETWSRGVELARQDAVTGDSKRDDEIVLRVLDRASGVSAKITLLPEDGDWQRDCSCKNDPCHHVAAAVIALRRAHEQGQDLPKSKIAAGHIIHALTRDKGFIHLERLLSCEGLTQILTVPLSSISTGRITSVPVTPSRTDLAIESALQGERRGRLSAATLARIMPLLVEAIVTLDGEPCKVSREALGLVIHLKDEGHGIHVVGRRDARITETFTNGVVLAGDTLHPQADLQLDHEERQLLQTGRVIPLRDLEVFCSETLPAWQRRFKIDNQTQNMPEFVEVPPQLNLHLEIQGQNLWLQPGIVYGDPPIASIREGVFRPSGREVPIRDHAGERRLKDELWRQWGMELYQGRLYAPETGIRLVEQLSKWQGTISGDGLQQFRNYGPVEVKLQWRDGHIDCEWQLAQADAKHKAQQLDLHKALAAYERGESLVPLLDGGFAELPMDWFAQFGQQLRALLLAQEQNEVLPASAKVQALDLLEGLGHEIPPDLAPLRKLRSFTLHEAKAHLPEGFNAELRGYQSQGVAWLQHLQELELGALLADDMGLGKTVQAIAVLPRGSLVIAPSSVIPNWQRELQRFRPNLKVHVYHGSQRHWQDDADIVISSYGLLRSDQESFYQRPWQAVVLDEAQIIKNPESKVAQAARQLQAKFRLALSGTPVENRLDDLWSLFSFINPGLLGSRKDFRERFSRPIEEGQGQIAQGLRQMVRPFILRRLKREVAPELPPRIEKVLYAELWPEERQLYQTIQAATQQDLIDRLQMGASVIEALEALLRLRQACCHPGLIPQQSALHSSKLTVLMESLDVALAEGHKALVFSQWTSLLDRLEPILETAGIKFLRLDGSTQDRQSIVDQFQAEDGPPVLIMSLKAGGVGLNLTQADHVFILDPWWNPASQDQAADRAHRIGQTKTVMIHPIVALGTVEEKILELQAVKRSLAAAALGEGAVLPSLTREDLMYLLSS